MEHYAIDDTAPTRLIHYAETLHYLLFFAADITPPTFTTLYRATHALLFGLPPLDAISIATSRRFDCRFT